MVNSFFPCSLSYALRAAVVEGMNGALGVAVQTGHHIRTERDSFSADADADAGVGDAFGLFEEDGAGSDASSEREFLPVAELLELSSSKYGQNRQQQQQQQPEQQNPQKIQKC